MPVRNMHGEWAQINRAINTGVRSAAVWHRLIETRFMLERYVNVA